MKNHSYLLWLTALLPYFVVTAMAMIVLSSDVPFLNHMMETAFHNTMWNVIGVLLICCEVAAVLSVVHVVLAVCRKWDARSLIKTALVIKLFQIPAYLLIFAIGAASFVTIFTIPFAVGLFLLDGLTLVLTGLVTIAAVVNAVRDKQMTLQTAIPFALLQFVFCADVLATAVLHRTLKKAV